MAILITGGMGHVGYETVRQTLAAGHEVVAQYRNVFREADARALPGPVTWVRCDLAILAEVNALVEQYRIEGCIHTAAVPNDLVARKDPVGTVDANVGAVCGLLEAARHQGWRRFLNISTGSVFQNAIDPQQPILEDAPPTVTNTYSTTKYAGELLTRMYRSQFSVPAATVRISWVYGPPLVPRMRENPRGPIPLFLKLALGGKAVREAAGGEFAASYTYVGDVAAGLLAAYTAKALANDIYHLGSGRNFDTAEVAAAVRAAIPGALIDIGPGTAPWTDDTRMRGPLAGTRLREDTGFAILHSLESGVAAFAAWMRAHPESYRD